MKSSGAAHWVGPVRVAPFTGAWIEITPPHGRPAPMRVAPFTGAWIEIAPAALSEIRSWSLPSRERGLKSAERHLPNHCVFVAPFTGAWIEMLSLLLATPSGLSLPSRERGLKYQINAAMNPYPSSLPSRERGLKYESMVSMRKYRSSLPSRERGLKSYYGVTSGDFAQSLPSRERGLKYRRVRPAAPTWPVAPFTGAWIEIVWRCQADHGRQGRSLHGSVD